MDGARQRIIRDSDNRVQLAWLIASLSRAKKIPDLSSLLKTTTKTHATPPSWEIQQAKWEAYAARKGVV